MELIALVKIIICILLCLARTYLYFLNCALIVGLMPCHLGHAHSTQTTSCLRPTGGPRAASRYRCRAGDRPMTASWWLAAPPAANRAAGKRQPRRPTGGKMVGPEAMIGGPPSVQRQYCDFYSNYCDF